MIKENSNNKNKYKILFLWMVAKAKEFAVFYGMGI